MDQYADTSYKLSEYLTKGYSTSFSLSSSLFDKTIRKDIYAVYGMVRIADEIVDTYRGPHVSHELDMFQSNTYEAMERGFSSNPILHAFALTAKKYDISKQLITPFFNSMRTDISKKKFTKSEYRTYIYGSAEVIGLMCLKIFVGGDAKRFIELSDSAKALGSAYQKINFLRDLQADYKNLGRCYFPGLTYETFDEVAKQYILDDIKADLRLAAQGIRLLPKNSRLAVETSYKYYSRLLEILEEAPVEKIKTSRLRMPNSRKLLTLVKARAKKVAGK